MYEINIIKNKSILPQIKKKIFMGFIGISVVSLILIVSLLVYIGNISAQIDTQKDNKNSKTAVINEMIEKYNINEWGKEWRGYYEKLHVVDRIYTERISLAVKFRELSRLLPTKMCIEKIDLDKGTKSLVLGIIALADEHGEFGQVQKFNKALEESKCFGTGIRLVSQERIKIKDKDVNKIIISIPVGAE